jgi:arylsulfatase A-like enzyme
MDRRKFIGLMSSGIATMNAGKAVFSQGPSSNISAQDRRPNFLFIIADDLNFRNIRALNNSEIHTPNIDKLVAKGCAFTHCFHQGGWSGAICVPSRTMLNTGLTTFHANESTDQTSTVPAWGQTLGAHGYDTFITGKWHLDGALLQRSFKEMGPVGPGYLPSTDDMYDRPSPGNHWESSDTKLKGHWLHTDLWLNEAPDSVEHSSVLYADAAVDHLTNKVAKRNTPFFMYIGFNAPHDPRQAPQEYLDLYPQDKIEIPPNYLPEHPFDQGQARTRDELLAPFPRTKEAVQLHRREYYAIISHMDHQIGRILDALEASGKASNTYIIFTADHGLAVGEHGLMGKQNQYECSMRMPLIFAGPGISAGRRIDEMVYQHSTYATTCDLAGIPIPKTVEFPSLAPMLHGDTTPVHDAMFGWLAGLQRSVRTKKYKLIFYPPINRYQLFNLEEDPWEIHDRIADPEYASIKAEMIGRLKSLQQELGDKMDGYR